MAQNMTDKSKELVSESDDDSYEEGEYVEDSQQDEASSGQFINLTKPGRKHLCDTCVKSLAKYTCPGCHIKSCGMQCVNKHKIDYNCAGKADKTKYVAKNDIKEDTVQSDFVYMKEMLSQTDKVKKMLTGVTSQSQEPKRFYFLRKFARAEYNIKIHQAPAMIERHRENISFYYMKTQTIYWVLEILYYVGKQDQNKGVKSKNNNKWVRKLMEEPQSDQKAVLDVLPKDYICPQLLLQEINTTKVNEFHIFIENRAEMIGRSNTNGISTKEDGQIQQTTKQIKQSNDKSQTNPKQQNQRQKKQDQKQKTKPKQKQKSNTKQQNRQLIEINKQHRLCQQLRNTNIYQFPTLMLVHASLLASFKKQNKCVKISSSN